MVCGGGTKASPCEGRVGHCRSAGGSGVGQAPGGGGDIREPSAGTGADGGGRGRQPRDRVAGAELHDMQRR